MYNSSKLRRNQRMSVINLLQPVWSLSPFSSRFIMRVCKSVCVFVRVCETEGERETETESERERNPLQWRLLCTFDSMAPVFVCVCVSAFGCMTMALNPVTGCGMSFTEITAEPVTPSRITMVCVTTPREANKLAHTPPCTHADTSFLCLLQVRGGDGVKPRV